MAKQKKDQEDQDNINEENLDDINEVDDSFGLPDVDYQPLESESSEDPTDSEDTYAYTADAGGSYGEESQAGASDEPEYIPGSYTPPGNDSNRTGMVIGIVIVLLLAAGAIWYFGFHRPAQIAEQERIEKQRREAAAKRKREAELQAERERIAREQAELEAAEQAADEIVELETGMIEAISSRTGRYYVVVASAIDGDLAMDYAKELSESGQNVKIIEPYGRVKFYRVTINDQDTWNDAQDTANELKGQYGDGVWVIKY